MKKILKAESKKLKSTFGKHLLWLAPVMTLLMSLGFTPGAFAEGAWNWWYGLLMPGMLALFCHLSIAKEKKNRYYNLTTLSTDKKKLMCGKLLYVALMLLMSNIIVFAGTVAGGMLFATAVPISGAFAAVFVLTIVQLWEIPLFLFLSTRFGMVVDILVCMVLTVGGVIIAPSGKWWIFPFAIPARVMCPLLHIMPNGLAALEGNPLLDMGVLLPGIVISLLWFLAVTLGYLRWFDRTEVTGK